MLASTVGVWLGCKGDAKLEAILFVFSREFNFAFLNDGFQQNYNTYCDEFFAPSPLDLPIAVGFAGCGQVPVCLVVKIP